LDFQTIFNKLLMFFLNLISTITFAEQSERVVIKYANGKKNGVQAALQKMEHHIHREFPARSAIVASLPSSALDGLRHNPNIEFIEPDAIRHQFTTETTPYGIKLIQADQIDDIRASNTSVCN